MGSNSRKILILLNTNHRIRKEENASYKLISLNFKLANDIITSAHFPALLEISLI